MTMIQLNMLHYIGSDKNIFMRVWICKETFNLKDLLQSWRNRFVGKTNASR
jgi:hypothetical protein